MQTKLIEIQAETATVYFLGYNVLLRLFAGGWIV